MVPWSMLFAPVCVLAGVLNPDQTLEEAKSALAPFLENLMKLDPTDMEQVIYNHWFDWAHELIGKSHKQGADLSFPVRKATRNLKNQADELVRALNPKYGVAQLVNPSFRWAQNDTSVFLNVKFSTRWNAPGALEVNNAVTNFERGSMNFTGFGEHSNLKYKYELQLDLFDYIVPDFCTWSAASVGRLSIILRKRWARKWPRLLVNKKQKISNMFAWMDFQDSQNLDDVPNATHSPPSCAFEEKLYCVATEKCVAKDMCADDCKQATPTDDLCAGKPSSVAQISFVDTAMTKEEIAGTFKVKAPAHTFDIDTFELYWADSAGTRKAHIASIPFEKEATFELKGPQAPGDTHVVVVPVNSIGEYDGTNTILEIEDGHLPLKKVSSISFEDTDSAVGKLGGILHIVTDEVDFIEVTVCWGKSKSQKVKSGSHIRTHKLDATAPSSILTLVNEKIPAGAKYILVFPSNKHGEGAEPEYVKIDDISAPCSDDALGNDCIQEISLNPDSNIIVGKGTFAVLINKLPADISRTTHIAIYFGRNKCDPTGTKDGEVLKELSLDELQTSLNVVSFVDVDVPDTTTSIQVYTKNQHGESRNCISESFIDHGEFSNEGNIRYVAREMAHMIRDDKGMLKILKRVCSYTGSGKDYSELASFLQETFKDETKRAEFMEAVDKYVGKKKNKQKKKEKKDEL